MHTDHLAHSRCSKMVWCQQGGAEQKKVTGAQYAWGFVLETSRGPGVLSLPYQNPVSWRDPGLQDLEIPHPLLAGLSFLICKMGIVILLIQLKAGSMSRTKTNSHSQRCWSLWAPTDPLKDQICRGAEPGRCLLNIYSMQDAVPSGPSIKSLQTHHSLAKLGCKLIFKYWKLRFRKLKLLIQILTAKSQVGCKPVP